MLPDRHRALCALAVSLLAALAPPALSNQAQSLPNTMFVPGSRVPLSEFKNRLLPAGTTSMHVHPDIMAWIQASSATVQVAVKNGAVQYLTPSSVNYTTGLVTLSGSVTGKCVVTSSALKQDLDIATHWDPALNGGKGGQSLGATGGIITLGFDFQTMQLSSTPNLARNTDPLWAHPTAGEYHFASNLYSVFSDGSGAPDAELVPAYERYVGETYSLNAITKSRAIWLSDLIRARTGFPIAHRSHPSAFDPGAPLRKRAQDGLPIFQLVHCHLVDIGNLYPATPGNENSLGTFILPPSWTSAAAAGTYPILFNGFYDIHASTFHEDNEGTSFLTTLGALYKHPEQRLAVGLLWNGGGASATPTSQRSAYDNANQLIQDAAALLKADPERVVITGGSRGGFTALEIASNPYDLPYTVKFAHANAPNPRLGDAIDQVGPTYLLGMSSYASVTGYKDAWTSGWQEPGSGNSGRALAKLNLYNTTNTQTINDFHCPDSALFRDRLEAEGTGLVYGNGTHDYSHFFTHTIDYVHNLRSLNPGVQLRFELFYRAGHNRRGVQPDDLALMNQVFDGVTTLATGSFFYATDPNDPEAIVQITPDHIPLIYETPLIVGSGQLHNWSYVGEPGGRVQIWSTQMPSGWNPGDAPPSPSALGKVHDVILSSNPGQEFGTAGAQFQLALPSSRYWWYEARYSPDGDAVFETVLSKGDVPAPPTLYPSGDPVVFIWPGETLGGAFDTRTGGLSGDAEFLP